MLCRFVPLPASLTRKVSPIQGGDCTSFIERNGQNQRVLISEPALWTENWMGWFDAWGGKAPAGDWPTFESTEQSGSKAFGILRWTARGGSHVNFYNWAGGNHFARNAGSSMVNVYYWKAPIAPDNLAQGPERKHMSRVYAAIAQVSDCILSTDAQLHKQKMLPGNAMAFVYSCGDSEVVFLENGCEGGGSCPASVAWQGKNHSVPPGSATILEDGEAIFNSADVKPLGKKHVWTATSSAPLAWKAFADPAIPKSAKDLPPPSPPYTPWAGSALGRVVTAEMPLEQVNFTEYDSELLMYSRVVTKAEADALIGSHDQAAVPMTLQSAVANAWTIFADGKMVGSGWELGHHGGAVHLGVDDASRFGGKNISVDLSAVSSSSFLLTMMSTSVGIDNGGGIGIPDSGQTIPVHSTGIKGIVTTRPGAVVLGETDLTRGPWTHRVGAVGEAKEVFTTAGAATVTWSAAGKTAAPMTWLTATFAAPAEVLAQGPATELEATLNLDVTGLSRGRFFVNGMDLGRYWSKTCGQEEQMCQRYYPLPFDKLKASGNVLTVLDEMGARDLAAVRLAVSKNQ